MNNDNDNDNEAPDCLPTANGILLCLRMLADEALSLNLVRSVAALQQAARTIELEMAEPKAVPPGDCHAASLAGGRAH